MDVLLMGQRRAKSPAPGGIRNHNLSATRHVLYHCATTTAKFKDLTNLITSSLPSSFLLIVLDQPVRSLRQEDERCKE